jgi:DNA-binding XRE family transcriptional regulator
MSEATLPVNQSGPGLTLVYGWPNEDRRSLGVPASVQGIDFTSSSGKVLPLDFCPWCGAKIASSSGAIRNQTSAAAGAFAPSAPSAPRVEPPAPPPPVEAPRPSRPREAPPAAEAPAREDGPRPNAALKAIRERLGLSQAELGEKLGLARSSVANYENGRAPLSQRLLKWIAKNESKLK